MPDQVDISILLIAYNQRPFIEKALQSAQSQRTSRSVEIIVYDDASTDGTQQIIETAAEFDPRIRPIFSSVNRCSNAALRIPLEAAQGRYISILDADDFWIFDDKLERQADILDADEALAGCFHNAQIIEGEGFQPSSRRWTPQTQPKRVDRATIWEGNPFATCAGMLRRDALSKISSDWFDKFFLNDWAAYAVAASEGDLLFVDAPVGAYRLHERGTYSSVDETAKLKRIAEFYRYTSQALEDRGAKPLAAAGAARLFGDWALDFAHQGKRAAALRCLYHAARLGDVGGTLGWRKWAAILAKALK